MPQLASQTVLITGASSGLGAHFARACAAEGAQVIAAARRQDKCEKLAADFAASQDASAGGTIVAAYCDVSRLEDIDNLFATYDVDVVINNAGMNGGSDLATTNEETWNRVIDIDLTSVARVARSAINQWQRKSCGGVLVNVASILGQRVAKNMSAYVTAKAGVIQLTKSIALDYGAQGIRANALCPGYFPSELTQNYLASEAGQKQMQRVPMGRHGQLDELTGPLLLLAGPNGSYINGAVLAVDGGHLVSGL